MNDLEKALTPADYGAVAWGGLHTLAREDLFYDRAWRGYIEYLRYILDPQKSPATGCPECRVKIEKFCRENPPEEIGYEVAAQRWGWMAHNAVRADQGKDQPSFEEAAVRWGW